MIMPWIYWCRLCSKDNGCEIDIFDHKSECDDGNETENNVDLYKIIMKYFEFTIDENDDSIPKGICQDCLKFIQNLQLFSDRQVKVEKMFTKLIDDKLLSIEDIDFNDIRQKYGIKNEAKALKCDQSTDTTDLRLSAVKTEPNEDHMYKEYHETGSNNDENEPLHEPICFLIKTENTCDEEETVGNETDSPSAARTAILKKKRKLNAKEIKYIADDEEEENHQNNSEEDSDETDEYDSEEVDDDDDEDDDCHKKEKKISKMKEANDGVNQQQLKPKDKDSKVKSEIKCELCEKVFTRKNSKRMHMERVHSQPQQCNYECSICDKKFTSSRGLKQHALVHLPRSEEMYSCPFCDRKFIKACNVNPHIRAKHSDEKNKSLICEDCGKTFSTNGGLKEHKCTHNNSKEDCDEVNEYDNEEVEDDDDDDDCHKKEKKIFKINTTNDGVNQQQLKPKDKDSNKKAEFKCELCDKVLSRKNSKRMHMERVHSQTQQCTYECSICDKKFTSSRGLKQHALVHLPRSEEMLYSCQFCDRKFIKACNFNSHIRAKHSEKNKSFICEDCGKIFSTNGGLKEHRYTHIEETPFECSRCPKKFKNASRLKLHEDTHNGTVYVCPDCGLKLNTRRTLYMHMVIHSDEKKHKCEFCGAEFRQSRTLKNHLLLHTGIKPYTCQFCDKTFTQGTSCRSHKKKVHAAELAALEKAGKECNPTPNIPKLEQLKAMAANSPFRMQPFRTPISTGSTIKKDLM